MTGFTANAARKIAWVFVLSMLGVVPLFLASTALADPKPYLLGHAPATIIKRTRSFVGDGFYPVVNSACSGPGAAIDIPVVDQSPPSLGVLVDPVVVGVFWPGAVAVDASSRALFPDFVKDLFDGPFWAAEMPQYVGSSHGSYLSSHDITLLTLAPSTTVLVNQIGPELAAQMLAGGLPAPASENTVYVVHFPPGITIMDTNPNGFGTSCVEFCAYHDYHYVLTAPPVFFTFTVQPDFTQNAGCQAGCGAGTSFDKYTEVLAHELFEVTTNPYGSGWINQCEADGGEEIADICQSYEFYVPRDTTSAGAPQCPNRWAMQAVYSDAAIGAHGPLNACAVTGSTTDSTCVEPTAVCGNSIVEAGEQCDDGNSVSGDCCSATCQFETIGSSCTDGNVCTDDACDGAGSCISTNNTAPCDGGLFCTDGVCPIPPTPDPYLCYTAALARGQSKFTPAQKTLQDRLGTLVVDVKGFQAVCNPTQTAEHPTVHQVGYKFAVAKTTPPQAKFVKSNQTVVDQFGSHPLTVVKPLALRAPSAKVLGAGGTPTVNTTGVDHFLCYGVMPQKGAPKFVAQTVPITDQFGTRDLTLAKITKLCTPVNKNNEDPFALDHPKQLVCYQAKLPKGTKFAPTTVSVNNTNFGPAVLVAKAVAELCVQGTVAP